MPSLSDVTDEDFSSAPPEPQSEDILPELDVATDTPAESQPEEILPELDIAPHEPPEITEWSGSLPEIFWSLNKEEIDQIVSASIAASYTKGQAIVKEGEEGDSIFVLINGNARVEACFGNRNIELATLKGGDVFGEVAFLSGTRRTASVIAESDIKVLDISRDVLEQAIEKHPRILSCLAEYYHNRVQATLKKLRPKKPKGRLIIRD
jgi:CRP-like cAMP-binding protein